MFQPSQLTWLASAPFRAQHPLVSGRLSRARPGVRADCCPHVPAAFRPPAFASRPSSPAWYSAPLAIGLPSAARSPLTDHDGVPMFRTLEIRPDWVPSMPRDQRCSHRPRKMPACRLPPLIGTDPAPRPGCHLSGAVLDEASTRVHAIHPPGLPLARSSRMTREPLGLLPRAPHPHGQDPRTHAGEGTGSEH